MSLGDSCVGREVRLPIVSGSSGRGPLSFVGRVSPVNVPALAVGYEMHVEPRRTTARKEPTSKRQPVAAVFRSACACSQIAADNRDAIHQ